MRRGGTIGAVILALLCAAVVAGSVLSDRLRGTAKAADPEEGSDCAACHGTDMRRERPADHEEAWLERHGKESGWRVFDEHGRDCATCHPTGACTSCHATARPRSHTGLWRLKTHGMAAEMDEASCRTCHETGACVQCHKRTAPMSHQGAWSFKHGTMAGSGFGPRCAVCHGPTDCASCHAR
jgi:hypothetical protein